MSPNAIPKSLRLVGTPGSTSTYRLKARLRPTRSILAVYVPRSIHNGATSLIASPGAVFTMYTSATASGITLPALALDTA